MGKLFEEFIEDNTHLNCKCNNCNVTFTNAKYIKNIEIETTLGSCCSFTFIINYLLNNKSTLGQFHKSHLFYMYDFNCPLHSPYSKDSIEIYCKHCLYHIGWKHNNNYILLKNSFM